jgi:hypothetical protein
MLGWLTGKNAEKALDVIGERSGDIVRGIDAAWYTPEEKAETALEKSRLHLRLLEAVAKGGTAQAVTRRIIAVALVMSFLWWVNVAGVCILFKATDVAGELMDLCRIVAPYVGGVAIFYFGPDAIAGGVQMVRRPGKK